MENNLSETGLERMFSEEIQKVSSLEELEKVRVKYLGKKGEDILLLKKIGIWPLRRGENLGQG